MQQNEDYVTHRYAVSKEPHVCDSQLCNYNQVLSNKYYVTSNEIFSLITLSVNRISVTLDYIYLVIYIA